MKIFQEIILNFSSAVIYWPQKHLFNFKNIAILFTLVVGLYLSALFFLFEAKTFDEYADSFYATVTTIYCSVGFPVATSISLPCIMLPVFILTLFNHLLGESDIHLLVILMW